MDEDGKPTDHFGVPIRVYYQFRLAKNDSRSQTEIYEEGRRKIEEIRGRGVPIAEGHGDNIWDLQAELEEEVRSLYKDAKVSLWTEMDADFVASVPAAVPIASQSKDREDYVNHPESGEKLSEEAISSLTAIRKGWKGSVPIFWYQ